MSSMNENGPVAYEKILKRWQFIFAIMLLSSHGEGRGPFLKVVYALYFHYFVTIIFSRKWAWSLIGTNLNLNLPRMLCCGKFGWNRSSGSGEEDNNVKVYDNDDTNDDRQWTYLYQKSLWSLSLRLGWAKRCSKILAHLSWKLKWAFLITCRPSSVLCLSVRL